MSRMMLESNYLFTWIERRESFSVECLVFIVCFLILSGYRWDFVRLIGGDNEAIRGIFCSVTHERLRLLFRIDERRRRVEDWRFVNERAFDTDSEALAAMIGFVECWEVGVEKPEHVSSWERNKGNDERMVVEDGWLEKNDFIFSLDELWSSILRLSFEWFISLELEFVRKYWSCKSLLLLEFRTFFE